MQHDGVAFITRMGLGESHITDLTMRPLTDQELRVKTTLITRLDDRSRLMSEYLRTAMRRLKPPSVQLQQSSPLTG